MLFMMTLEGASDSPFATENTIADGAYSHAIETGEDKDNVDLGHVGGEQGSDHCEHCCHGHTSCISAVVTLPASNEMGAPLLPRDVQFRYYALAPPTPPPNA